MYTNNTDGIIIYCLHTAELQYNMESRRVKRLCQFTAIQDCWDKANKGSDIQRKVNRLASRQPPLSAQRTPRQAWRPTPTSVFWVQRSGGEYRRSALGEYSLQRTLEWKLRMTDNIIKQNARIDTYPSTINDR